MPHIQKVIIEAWQKGGAFYGLVQASVIAIAKPGGSVCKGINGKPLIVKYKEGEIVLAVAGTNEESQRKSIIAWHQAEGFSLLGRIREKQMTQSDGGARMDMDGKRAIAAFEGVRGAQVALT
jgi:hypothetical protein